MSEFQLRICARHVPMPSDVPTIGVAHHFDYVSNPFVVRPQSLVLEAGCKISPVSEWQQRTVLSAMVSAYRPGYAKLARECNRDPNLELPDDVTPQQLLATANKNFHPAQVAPKAVVEFPDGTQCFVVESPTRVNALANPSRSRRQGMHLVRA